MTWLSVSLLRKAVVLLFSAGLASCAYYFFAERLYLEKINDDALLKDIEYIAIESMTGRDSARLLPILAELIALRGVHQVVNQIPQGKEDKTAILRVNVEEVIFYESQVVSSETSEGTGSPFDDSGRTSFVIRMTFDSTSIRVNSALNIQFDLRNASSSLPVYSREIGRTFQQVYHTPDSIANRPDASLETDRLARLIFTSFAQSIDTKTNQVSYSFEQGRPPGLSLREKIGFKTNAIMVKGLRYALGKDWEFAILTWLVVAFEPPPDEPAKVFLANRASAFFNMGQVLQINKQWEMAARMYAEANLAWPRLHYAQFWSDMIIRRKLAEQLSGQDNEPEPEIRANGLRKGFSAELKKRLEYSLEGDLPQEYQDELNRSLILDEKSLYTDVRHL